MENWTKGEPTNPSLIENGFKVEVVVVGGGSGSGSGGGPG